MIIFWHGYLLIFIKLRNKGGVTATACSNYRAPVLPRYVDFSKGEKPEHPEKNPQSTGETNYENSTPMKN